MTWPMAKSPMPYAAALRTNDRRLIPIRRRSSSPTSSCSSMIRYCSRVGGGGMNSPFDAGITSIGIISDSVGSSSSLRKSTTATAPRSAGSLDDAEGAAHARVDPAPERVRAGLGGLELPDDGVLDPLLVVGVVAAD